MTGANTSNTRLCQSIACNPLTFHVRKKELDVSEAGPSKTEAALSGLFE